MLVLTKSCRESFLVGDTGGAAGGGPEVQDVPAALEGWRGATGEGDRQAVWRGGGEDVAEEDRAMACGETGQEETAGAGDGRAP